MRPFWDKVTNFNIQKTSPSFNQSLKVGLLTFSISFGSSIKVNFAFWIKFCPSFLKWTLAGRCFVFLTSFWWLFNLMLKLVFDLPTYWRLHSIHSSRLIMHWLLHVIVCYMLKTLFVWLFFECIIIYHFHTT